MRSRSGCGRTHKDGYRRHRLRVPWWGRSNPAPNCCRFPICPTFDGLSWHHAQARLLLAVAFRRIRPDLRSIPGTRDRLLQRAVIVDLHDDTTQMILDEGYNLGEKHDFGQVDIPRMRAGHVTGLFLLDLDRPRPLHSHRIHSASARTDRRGAPRDRAPSRGPGHPLPLPTRSWRPKSAGISPS
jgi:hypothetical protein